MKLSEIAHYWAARKFANVMLTDEGVVIKSPFATKDFSLELAKVFVDPVLSIRGTNIPLKRVSSSRNLAQNTWSSEGELSYFCLDLEQGITLIKDK